MSESDENRQLFLAISNTVYENLINNYIIKKSIERCNLKLLVIDLKQQKIEKYQHLIIKVLEDYKKQFRKTSKDIEGIIVSDRENRYYQFVWLGWDGPKHILTVTTFISIINEKIWIQHDNTEIGIANLLVDEGIPKSDIVLGYFSPDHRALTEFAAA